MTAQRTKQNIDREMNALTPAELAKYIRFEEERIMKSAAAGKDISKEYDKLSKIYFRYVSPSTIYDITGFWISLHSEARILWGRYWLTTYHSGLTRERALVLLLILEKTRSWKLGLKGQKEQEQIRVLVDRFKELSQELKNLIKSDIWEICDFKRPEMPDNSGEFLIEEALELMHEFTSKNDTPRI